MENLLGNSQSILGKYSRKMVSNSLNIPNYLRTFERYLGNSYLSIFLIILSMFSPEKIINIAINNDNFQALIYVRVVK